MGEGEFSLNDSGFCADAGVVLGLADIDSDKEQAGLLNILFTFSGISSIIFKSHGSHLLDLVVWRFPISYEVCPVRSI